MSDPKQRLEEYVDGLLPDAEARALERRLATDEPLCDELEKVRRFKTLLGRLHDARAEERAVQRILGEVSRRRHRLVLFAAAAAGVAALVLAWFLPRGGDPNAPLVAEWREFGRRLGAMAAQRRAGRAPRTALPREVPPALAMDVVFDAALRELRVAPEPDAAEAVKAHFVAIRDLPEGVLGEAERAERSLDLYRRLRRAHGPAIADAYYDVFRPGLAQLTTARRVPPGMAAVVAGQEYVARYEEALARLQRRYGPERLALVLDRLAPDDRRAYFRDASQDGVPRDAVLSIRAAVYRAAAQAGAESLFVES